MKLNIVYVICLFVFVILSEGAPKNENFFKVLCDVNCLEYEQNQEIIIQRTDCTKKCNSTNYNTQVFPHINDVITDWDEIQLTLLNKKYPPPVLHCRAENVLNVKWKSWNASDIIYFVELRSKELEWISINTTLRRNFMLTNLKPSTEYQIRIWGIQTGRRIIGSSMSSWITTLQSDFTPNPVAKIMVQALRLKKNFFEVVVEWLQNTEDLACFYDLVWYGENSFADHGQKEFKEPSERFEVIIEKLEFNTNYHVVVRAKSGDWERESSAKNISFSTPTCLEAFSNLTMCSPAQPTNLTSNENLVKFIEENGIQTALYDVTITWDPPKYVPEFYIVLLKSYIYSKTRNFTQNNVTVPGNQTMTTFRKVDLGVQYHIFVTAHSTGRTSEPALHSRHMTHTRLPTPSRYIWVGTTVGLTIVIIIALLVTGSYIYYRRAKQKRYERRCKYFEELEEKMPKNIDCITSESGLVLDDSHQEYDNWELRPERLVLQSVLGEGAFGLVRRAWLRDDKGNASTEVAVKMLKDTSSSEQRRNFMHEIDIMKTVGSHAHLVSILGCCTRPRTGRVGMMLVVEYCALGDLQNYLRGVWDRMTSQPEQKIQYADLVSPTNSEGSANLIINKMYELDNGINDDTNLQPSDLLSFSRQIARGMEFLSHLKVLHRDLAARNVLVCADKSVKIADFGLSRDVYKDNMYRKMGNGKLPIRWMAIESLTHQFYTSQSDVWSFGILLWEIVTLGGNPYPSVPTNALLKLLKSGYRMERPLNCGPELYSIMLSCWKIRPKDRPTFPELRNSIDVLLESVTTSKYLDLDVLTSTEFASFRVPCRDSSSITLKGRIRSPEKLSSERYVHPVLLNNAKNSDLSAMIIK